LSPPANISRPFLAARDVGKSFGGVPVLTGINLEIQPGQIHALMGENGAGKSTLMKIFSGLLTSDTGRLRLRGDEVRFRNPHDALRQGIAMIHQELLPFPALSVAENIFMGQEPTCGLPGWIDRRRQLADARELLNRLGSTIPANAPMGRLGVAEMQLVEIAKALAHRAGLLIMDEPTSALSQREVDTLLRLVRDLQQSGVAILYVSHKLEEVRRLATTITVLRDGGLVRTAPAAGLDDRELIRLMVGREITQERWRRPARPATTQPALRVQNLSLPGRLRDISLTVAPGEIVGLAGLMGAGRTELLNSLAGLEPASTGEVRVNGVRVPPHCPAQAIANGLALVTEDRKRSGLVLPLSVRENLTLNGLSRCCTHGWLDRSQENRLADEQIRTFGIKTPSRELGVEKLSGGNQQKVVLAKALLTEPAVVLLDEPTRGIDVGAKAEIYALIRRLAEAGKSLLLASSEMPELLHLCDRILVLRQGELAGELRGDQATAEAIMRLAMPGKPYQPI
jgi:ABC-type sugar transport system ATPase subunit